MRLYGVTGHPVLHSRSPRIFRRLFSAAGVDAAYLRIAARTAEDALSLARRIGISGLNVTAPFKEDMHRIASAGDRWATRLGAANTVVIEPDAVRASNTDPAGVRHALAAQSVTARESRVVVLGAGGAAKAAAAALSDDGARVVVLSRTLDRAQAVASRLGCEWADLSTLAHELGGASGLVACLPAGVDPVDERALSPAHWVLDANYTGSPLAAKARRRGCTVLSGLDWLIGQARASYIVFSGGLQDSQRPPVETTDEVVDEGPRNGLALAGMMGAGKTAVGRAIAGRLQREFIDTDELVVERTGHDIRWLFDHRSEDEFRRIEADTIARVVDGRAAVIALGGGSLERDATRRQVSRHCRVIWLWASPDCLAARTSAGREGRPLLDGHDAASRLAVLLDARTPAYATVADLVVDSEQSIEDEASLVEFEVRRFEG